MGSSPHHYPFQYLSHRRLNAEHTRRIHLSRATNEPNHHHFPRSHSDNDNDNSRSSNNNNPQAQSQSTTTTPAISATPTTRERDSKSLHTELNHRSGGGSRWAACQCYASEPGYVLATCRQWHGGFRSPGSTIEYLRDLVQKRIIALTCTRNMHDGCEVYVYHLFLT